MAKTSRGITLSTTDDAFHALLEAARRDDADEIEHALEPLTGLPGFAVHWICETGSPESLAVVCRALGFKRQLFGALYARLHGAKPYRNFAASTAFRSAVKQFDRIQRHQARDILEHWKAAPITVWHDPRSGPDVKAPRRGKRAGDTSEHGRHIH